MSKIVLGALVVAALPLCGLAEDAYLYWMIDQPTASAVTFDYARMVSPDFTTTFLTADSGFLVSSDPATKTSTLGDQSMYLGAYNAGGEYQGHTSFLIELFTYTDGQFTSVAQSGIYEFINCSASIATNKDPQSGQANALKVSAFTIPEPTGGVLMLLGLAALGLKRKRG